MGTSPPPPRQPWIIAAAGIAALGIALHVAQWAGGRPLWLDEEMLAINVRDRPFAELAGQLWLGQSAPLGWLVLERLTVLIFGASEPALRLVPMIFGAATPAAALWIGRRWFGATGAVLLTLLSAFGQWTTFYSLELKPYAGDVFWALVLPALAVAACEASSAADRRPAAIGFWLTAVVAQFLSNGAALVTPACAVALVAGCWQRDGWRTAVRAAWLAPVWLMAFAGHYAVTVRFAIANAALQEYWSFALPPVGAGPLETLQWLLSRVLPFGIKPGGASQPLVLWVSYAIGVGVLLQRSLVRGVAVALIPLSALALAGLRLVPLFERLSLWIVPALFLGVAAGADAAWQALRRGTPAWRRLATPGAVVTLVLATAATVDVVQQGVYDLRMNRPRASNHDLNDREAIRWLMAQRQADDDLVTTRQGLPAVWWYGDLRIDGPHLGGSFERDGGQILVARHEAIGPACRANRLTDRLRDRRRVLVYLGFRVGDVPEAFDQMLIDDLRGLGVITADQRFSTLSRAFVLDLQPAPGATPRAASPARPEGCITLEPGQHW